jgi:hypothetical protein
MFLVIDTLNSSTVSKELSDSEKVKVQPGAGESTIRLLKPSELTDISTFDYVELRNYIYGVNGRY